MPKSQKPGLSAQKRLTEKGKTAMKEKKKKMSAARQAIEAYKDIKIPTDPDGMYTGNCVDMCTDGGKIYLSPDAYPVQDADDL